MKKFNVKFLREFEVDVEADDTAHAELAAQTIIQQFAPGACKLLSIVAEGVAIEVVTKAGPEGRTPPRSGPPNLGGSPGTPTVKVPVLVDQVAEAA